MENIFQRGLNEYQKKDLQWLLDRENSNHLPPFWEPSGNWFLNAPTKLQSSKRPEPLRGGIFNYSQALSVVPPLLYLIASTVKQQPTLPTLVVTNTMFHWKSQIKMYTIPDTLKFCVYNPERGPRELAGYHLVLTDHHGVRHMDIINQEWRRIILTQVDSGIPIENFGRLAALKGKRRWVVMDKTTESKHLDFLLLVLHLEPFSSDKNLIHFLGPSHLQVLLAAISLQRIEAPIHVLTTKTEEDYYVKLSPSEIDHYYVVRDEAEEALQHYNSVKDDKLLPYLESLIIRLRQICTDSTLCSPGFKPRDFEDVSKKPELILQATDAECAICISPPIDMLITICGHVFCRACIRRAIKNHPKCPLCRHALSRKDLFSASCGSSSKDDSTVEAMLSAKIDALIKLLSESKEENPATKSIVFSLFPGLLSSIEGHLKVAGFKTMFLHKEMNASDKTDIIEGFQVFSGEEPKVLLVTTDAINEKLLDLRAASKVYFMEAIKKRAEQRAVQCVYRNRQKKPVKVVRLIAEDTIEEKILKLHEKKPPPMGSSGKNVRCGWCPDRINLSDMSFILGLGD